MTNTVLGFGHLWYVYFVSTLARMHSCIFSYGITDVFNMGVVHCREKFKELEDDCLKNIPVVGYLLCLPLKLTIFCELVRRKWVIFVPTGK